MEFIADLHIHSRFSMATSKELTIPYLAAWASRKGINVLGSGDFTHPAWRQEIAGQLFYDEESGFYKGESFNTYFCLQTEISCIYKKNGKTRRNHNLIFAPNLDIAAQISQKLEKYGKLESDGRPIMKLDAHDLLEITLESSPESVFVPAHIWTPWYSLFGSKSGFDCIEECFGDLSCHIFALETGLSSDPPMNRLWSALDGFAMISNSDAHSGANLAREANLFYGKPNRHGMFNALRRAAKRESQDDLPCTFQGTLEFYPEEGKYHMDGHRNCGIMLTPGESRKQGGLCPVCGKPLTLGVLHRLTELADRPENIPLPMEPQTRMLVPLPEIVGQIIGCKPQSARTEKFTQALVESCGSELGIVCRHDPSLLYEIWEPLGEAVSRLRAGHVCPYPGFDGQYGSINIFSPEEQKSLNREEANHKPVFRKLIE